MNDRARKLLAGACFVLPLALAAATTQKAFAFLDPDMWIAPADGDIAGGAGHYGTGGQSDWGIQCSFCHIDNNKQQGHIDVVITAMPAFQDVGGSEGYKPGQVYSIKVDMTGGDIKNAADQGKPQNQAEGDTNHFALTVEDGGGAVQGIFETDAVMGGMPVGTNNCPPSVAPPFPKGITYMAGDCHAIFSLPKNKPAVTSWTFKWTAPAAGAGALTMFYGVVDGNSTHSSLDDDVKQGTVKLVEGT